MRLSLRVRFALASGLLVLLVATAVAVAGYVSLARSLAGQARRAVADQAVQLTRIVDTGTGESAGGPEGNYVDLRDPSLIGQLVRPGLWVAVAGSSGRTLGASSASPRGLAAPALLAACRRSGSSSATRSRPAAAVACQRVGSADRPVGFVVAGMPLASTSRTLETTRTALVAGVLLGGLGSFLLAWLLAARALRPLRLIARTARSIRQGDLRRRIGYSSGDELGELARELDASFGELEGALRRQERFVADASHELKTPLAAARANVQLLRRWAAEDPTAGAAALAALERSTARMGRIVADLIQLARGDDHLHYAREPVRLDDLLLEAQREARPLADGVELLLERVEQATVIGDRDRLLQLLANLIDNALRVTPPGGTVRLSLTATDEQAGLRVADEGPGIASDELAHLFERFYRGGGAEPGTGSGLGLAIARAIARAHAGDITAESDTRGGSVFTVELPLLRPSDAITRRPPALARPLSTPPGFSEAAARCGCRAGVPSTHLDTSSSPRRRRPSRR